MENTFVECSFRTDSSHCDDLVLELYKNEIDSFSIEDYSDLLDYTSAYPEELVDQTLLEKQDGSVTIRCYFEPDQLNLELLKGIETATGAQLETKQIAQEDWANNWKKYFKPKRVGSSLVVKPTWESYQASGGDVIVEIDPGMAFGTGTHETTMMCLSALERYVDPQKQQSVLDIGCGSGILGIAALKLGALDGIGVDFDPLAVEAAKENAHINGLSPKFQVKCGNLVDEIHEKYDIILVNIVADAIIELTGKISAFLKPGGVYIASGIINTRLDEVTAAFDAASFSIIERRALKDWILLVGSMQ